MSVLETPRFLYMMAATTETVIIGRAHRKVERRHPSERRNSEGRNMAGRLALVAAPAFGAHVDR